VSKQRPAAPPTIESGLEAYKPADNPIYDSDFLIWIAARLAVFVDEPEHSDRLRRIAQDIGRIRMPGGGTPSSPANDASRRPSLGQILRWCSETGYESIELELSVRGVT